MKIGISGASGNLGRAIIRELLMRDSTHSVVAISRTPDKVPEGTEARLGDYDKPATLAAAYADLDKLVIIPSSDIRHGVRGTQNEAAISAAATAGVRHIVFLSATGTRKQEEPAIGASYWRGEQSLIRLARTWTILRMNYYGEALAQEAQAAAQSGFLTGLAENNVAFVGRDDVAAAAAGILLTDGHAGAIYNATGARTYTGAERASLLSSILGKPVAFTSLPLASLQQSMADMGLPDFVIDAISGIQTDFAQGAFDIVTGDVEKLGGRPPKELRDVLQVSLT